MAENTRFKEMEKGVVVLRQSQESQQKHMEQQAKSIEDHHAALAMLSSKMDMLLKAFNAPHGNNQNMNESPEEHIPE